MKSKLMLCYAMACCLLAAACKPNRAGGGAQDAKTVVSVSIEPLRGIVERIGGPYVTVVTLVPKGSSPETYEPTPRQMMDLSGSKVCFLVGGLGFERTWADKLTRAAPGVAFVRAADSLLAEGGDPHVWTSPACMATIARTVCDALCRADSSHADTFRRGLSATLSWLETVDDSVRALLATGTERAFLVYHPALTRFAEAYGLEQIAIEQDGKEPSPARLASIIRACKEKRVRTIFVQMEFDKRNAELIAEETGARIVAINPLAYEWEEEMYRIAKSLQTP